LVDEIYLSSQYCLLKSDIIVIVTQLLSQSVQCTVYAQNSNYVLLLTACRLYFNLKAKPKQVSETSRNKCHCCLPFNIVNRLNIWLPNLWWVL